MPRESFSYKNEDIKVIWRPALCIHSRLCWTKLVSVFNPRKKPWINMAGAETSRIIEAVQKCPSGALSFVFIKPDESLQPPLPPGVSPDNEITQHIQCLADGPILIHGNFVIEQSDGTEIVRQGTVALCRCGGSANKPFCDGAHEANGFKG